MMASHDNGVKPSSAGPQPTKKQPLTVATASKLPVSKDKLASSRNQVPVKATPNGVATDFSRLSQWLDNRETSLHPVRRHYASSGLLGSAGNKPNAGLTVKSSYEFDGTLKPPWHSCELLTSDFGGSMTSERRYPWQSHGGSVYLDDDMQLANGLVDEQNDVTNVKVDVMVGTSDASSDVSPSRPTGVDAATSTDDVIRSLYQHEMMTSLQTRRNTDSGLSSIFFRHDRPTAVDDDDEFSADDANNSHKKNTSRDFSQQTVEHASTQTPVVVRMQSSGLCGAQDGTYVIVYDGDVTRPSEGPLDHATYFITSNDRSTQTQPDNADLQSSTPVKTRNFYTQTFGSYEIDRHSLTAAKPDDALTPADGPVLCRRCRCAQTGQMRSPDGSASNQPIGSGQVLSALRSLLVDHVTAKSPSTANELPAENTAQMTEDDVKQPSASISSNVKRELMTYLMHDVRKLSNIATSLEQGRHEVKGHSRHVARDADRPRKASNGRTVTKLPQSNSGGHLERTDVEIAQQTASRRSKRNEALRHESVTSPLQQSINSDRRRLPVFSSLPYQRQYCTAKGWSVAPSGYSGARLPLQPFPSLYDGTNLKLMTNHSGLGQQISQQGTWLPVSASAAAGLTRTLPAAANPPAQTQLQPNRLIYFIPQQYIHRQIDPPSFNVTRSLYETT